jgi:alpha-beta hydrolase superfamily lysophospholipase
MTSIDPVEYTQRTISSGGADIVLSVWEARSPVAAIVFIPATMVHPLFYEELLRGFAQAGFTVVGVHPVGHGLSPRTTKRYDIGDVVTNGRDAVTFALERYGLPVIAMGSSQGGVVAAALASEDDRLTAAFPHNVTLAELPDTIGISRFPGWLRRAYGPAKAAFRLIARVLPDARIPLGFYLERARISEDAEVWDKVERDPLVLTHYSLYFLCSLFTTVFPGLTNGGVRCPIYVVANANDRLFTPEYTQKVFDALRAPYKELVVIDFGAHMFLLTHPEEACEALCVKMHECLARVRANDAKASP